MPADSLLTGLRRITGLTEPPPQEEAPVPGPPPVDRLMEWLGDVISALAALGIAVAGTLTLAGLWIWEHTLEGRVYSRSWQKRMAERKARQITAASFRAVPAAPPAPGQDEAADASPGPPAIQAQAVAAPRESTALREKESVTLIPD